MSAIKLNNVSLLNKRYTYDQWKNGGVVINGAPGVPTLAFGEFGFAYSSNNSIPPEIRANTYSTDPITFANATLVSFPGLDLVDVSEKPGESKVATGKYIEGFSLTKTDEGSTLQFVEADLPNLTIAKNPSSGTGSFITGLTVDVNDPHKILYTLGDHPASRLTVTAGTNTANPTTNSVTVAQTISGSSSTHDHTITYTTVEVPTKKYVDDKVAGVEVGVSVTGTGNYVSNVTAENVNGKHQITITKDTLPTIPTLSHTPGGVSNDSTANVLGELSASNHTITTKTKQIKGSGTISVTPTAGTITIGIDDSNYATKDEVSQAMVFKGTLGDAADGATDQVLSAANKSQVGDTYKVVTAKSYTLNGKSVSLGYGDMVICRQIGTSTSYEWIVIPAGDDVDKFIQELTAGAGIAISGTKVDTTISHVAYGPGATVTAYDGGFTDNTKNNKTYGVKGKAITDINLDTHNLGHVTSATLSGDLDIVSEAGARLIVSEEEHITTVAQGTAINVTSSGTDKDRTYTVGHANVTHTTPTTVNKTPSHGGNFTYVSGITVNGQGHVTQINTEKVTLPGDNNSWRPVYVNDDTTAFLGSGTSSGELRIKAGTNITVAKDESNGTVTISTLGTATKTAPGFVKLGTNTTLTGGTNEKVYPVGTNSSGELCVNVPWQDTDVYGHRNDLEDNDFRFAVFKRDEGGHVVDLRDILAIDANY